MMSDEAVAAMLRSLNASAIPYMLTGSFATNLYGVPRSTKDADFVIQADGASVSALFASLKPPLRVEPRMSIETITGTSKHVVELTGAEFKIEIFYLTDDGHDQARFKRRKSAKLLGEPVWVPMPEDVVITKLRWSKLGRRNKDSDDLFNVLTVQGDNLDWPYIHRWCDAHGTRALLDQIRSTIPPIP